MQSPLKLLCLAPYPVANAAVRYRVLQYFPYLSKEGIQPIFQPFMNAPFFERFYEPGRLVYKALRLGGFSLRRAVQLSRAGGYDVVMIHREAAMAGPPLFEAFIARTLRKPLVFDFDDAVHLLDVSPAHQHFARFLKYPQKTAKTIGMSRAVIAGNRMLAEYASTLNQDVCMIPTVIDARIVCPVQKSSADASMWSAKRLETAPMVLGWIGSHTNYRYLSSLFPVLQEVARRRRIVVRVVGAGQTVSIPGVEVDNRPWHISAELELLRSFDIGLYPIVDDAWARGKSGFKAIQYMAVGIPALCSPVGAACDIVQDGVQGFLPATPESWIERLELLIDDPALRQQMGLAGRARVEQSLCLERQAPRLCDAIWRAAK